MKIGNINGTPEEINNFLVDNGINAEDLLAPFKRLHIKWVIIPTILFIVISIVLWAVNNLPLAIYGILNILEFLSILWFTAAVQIRFKNIAVSLLCLFILSIIFSFCLGVANIHEALEILRNGVRPK